MKNIIILFSFFLVSTISAQTNFCGSISNSSSTAFVYIPQGAEIMLDNQLVEYGSWIIAVYENSLGELSCAGQVQWLGSNTVFSIRGEDSNYEGFIDDEELQFYIELPSGCVVRVTQAQYDISPVFPSGGNYEFGGKSLISSMQSSLSLGTNTEVEDVFCFGEENGSIDLTITGPSPNYQMVWSNGANSTPINNLTSGDYFVTISDDSGCLWFDSITINSPPLLEVFSVSQSNADCPQSTNGSAIVEATGGLPPYSFLWSNNSTDEEVLNLEMGIYSVIVTDGNNCSSTLEVEIIAEDIEFPEILDSTLMIYLDNSGQANTDLEDVQDLVIDNCLDVEIQFQGQNYDCAYLGLNTSDIVAVDESGNQTTGQISIMIIDTISPIIQQNQLTLYLDGNGIAEINLQDIENTLSDNCSIESFEASQLLFDCSHAGLQFIEIIASDNSGNTASATFTVEVQDTIPPNLLCPNNINIDDCNELVLFDDPIFIDNCNLESLILIEGFSSGNVFPSGITTVGYVAVSTSGDSTSCSFEVEVLNSLNLSEDIEIPTCAFFDDGSISVEGIGGTEPYTYLWNTGSTNNLINNLPTGDYTVTITDNNGCAYSKTYIIDTPTPVFIDVENIVNESENCMDGSIQMNIFGGIPPYSYTWVLNGDTISNVESPENLQGGNYILYLIDSNDCIVSSGVIAIESNCISSTLEESNSKTIELFPNPTKSSINLRSANRIVREVEITIYNSLGNIVAQENRSFINESIEVDLSKLTSGAYFIKIQSEYFSQTEKIIKI